jgi:hypothetical protein
VAYPAPREASCRTGACSACLTAWCPGGRRQFLTWWTLFESEHRLGDGLEEVDITAAEFTA